MNLENAHKNELENSFQRYDALGVRFEDIAGVNEVKEELLEVIDYLKTLKIPGFRDFSP